jgi:hypothetical protein
MSANAVVGKGAKLKRGDGQSNEVFTDLAEINQIGLPNQSRPMIDLTDLGSVARVFKKGLKDAGAVAFSMNFTRASYIAMNADLDSDSSVNYQIVIPDTGATTIDFAAFVHELGGDIPDPDQKITVSVTMKISGDITITS